MLTTVKFGNRYYLIKEFWLHESNAIYKLVLHNFDINSIKHLEIPEAKVGYTKYEIKEIGRNYLILKGFKALNIKEPDILITKESFTTIPEEKTNIPISGPIIPFFIKHSKLETIKGSQFDFFNTDSITEYLFIHKEIPQDKVKVGIFTVPNIGFFDKDTKYESVVMPVAIYQNTVYYGIHTALLSTEISVFENMLIKIFNTKYIPGLAFTYFRKPWYSDIITL